MLLRRPLATSLLISTVLCTALAVGRVAYTGSFRYTWLVMPNLILAWIPFLCAELLPAVKSRAGRWALAGVWLAFFPNAPYIVTDLIHLTYLRDDISLYYDVLLVFVAAFTGLILAFGALRPVQALVAGARGRAAGWWAATGVWFLSGVGVYLGRFIRWNSWDLVRAPWRIVLDALRIFVDLRALLFVLVITAVLQVLYLVYCSSTAETAGKA